MQRSSAIHELFSLLAQPTNRSSSIDNVFLAQRLHPIFAHWEQHPNAMPTKLLLPIQHPLDYSPYFSMLFRDRYRSIIEVVTTAMRRFSTFLVYSATLQHDDAFGNKQDSRLLVHTLRLLNTSEQFILTMDPQHERTVVQNEILGELHAYIDSFQQAGGRQQVLHTGKQRTLPLKPVARKRCFPSGKRVFRNYSKFHVLLIVPFQNQWDFLLDEHSFAFHHLSYMLSLRPAFVHQLCVHLLNCILRDRTSAKLPFDQLIGHLLLLRHRIGLTPALLDLIRLLFQHKQFQEELFSNPKLAARLNRLTEALRDWPLFSMQFLELFRKLLGASMPTKLNDIIRFLRQLSNAVLRALLVNVLLRSIFKRRGLPRHILLSTLCSIFHLLVLDGSYSVDCLLALAYHIIRRVRKSSADTDVIQKSLKLYLIPMLINIYREIKPTRKQLLPPAFVLIHEYCLNTLNYYCSSAASPSAPFFVIDDNEAQLMCPCKSCDRLRDFLVEPRISSLVFDFSSDVIADHCLRHTLSKFPMLTLEYKHDPCTGREQTLIVSKCGYEEEKKQLCFHLRRLLLQLYQI